MRESDAPLNAVGRAIEAAKITKLQLSRDLRIGTTTIWRACRGEKIDGNSAIALNSRFPELDVATLIKGYPVDDAASAGEPESVAS